MKSEKEIEHDGIVRSVSGDKMTVEILSKAACSGCSARSLCSSSEQKSKEIEVELQSGQSYRIGETVTVVGTESMGIVAVVLCYVVPLVLMLIVMVILTHFGGSDVLVGAAALGVLVPYYAVLYLLRGKVSKSFVFRIRNKIE